MSEAHEQHDDHIWLTVQGEAWAIRSIERILPDEPRFELWRGYYPNIEFRRVWWPTKWWPVYMRAAASCLDREMRATDV